MKSRSSFSIFSTTNIDPNRHDNNTKPHNQTLIRNFFNKTTTTKKSSICSSSSKRPLSASSTQISTQSSSISSSQRCSDDDSSIPLSLTIIPNENSNGYKHRHESSRYLSSSLENTRPGDSAQVLRDSTTISNIIADTKIVSKSNVPKPKAPSSSQQHHHQQQLYIDFGQRNFAATNICPICGMLYVHGVQSDIQRHESICDNYQHGVLWSASFSTTTRTKSDSKKRPNHPNKQQQQQRVCYEWTLPQKNTKTKIIQESITKHYCLPSSSTKRYRTNNNTKNNNGRTSEGQWQRASIVEVR